jgi:hypothetical protein
MIANAAPPPTMSRVKSIGVPPPFGVVVSVSDVVEPEVVVAETVMSSVTCPEMTHTAVTLNSSPSTAGIGYVAENPDVVFWLEYDLLNTSTAFLSTVTVTM